MIITLSAPASGSADRVPRLVMQFAATKEKELLTLRPITLKASCEFIKQHHRHNKPPVGHKFSIAVHDADGNLVGVATAGRPVARHFDDGLTLEVNRTCTDGARNANSMLYGAVCPYQRQKGDILQLYILFGQRKERYTGECGIEALACTSYYDNDTNSDYLPEEKEKADKSGEFERTEIVTLEVPESALLDILRPTAKVIPATIG